MKIFQCGNCNHALFFENNTCENCGHLSGYRDRNRKMYTFDPQSDALIANKNQIEYKYCKNKEYDVCNWLLKKQSTEDYCSACRLNRTIPYLSDKENFEKWKNLEIAKHRLIYQLQKIGLALPSKLRFEKGLCFDFVSKKNNPSLMTGHANGVITILLSEADSVQREKMRKEFSEPYRTLIGHLRHEVGHYFWEKLVHNNQEVLTRFRTIFGNEQLDYAAAIQQYYQRGEPGNWQASFISKYATAHPWEDWAETWAHYLHIMDMVETAYFFRITVKPVKKKDLQTTVSFDPYTREKFDDIVATCEPLSFAVNNINRAMGIPDVYPFVITAPVIEKLKFIHGLLLPKRS